MIIAIITEYLANEGAPFYGGVDSRAINLGQELARRNEVHLFASLQSGEEGIEHYGDMIVHRVGRPRPFIRGGHFLSRLEFNKRCADEVSRLDPDVVEASGFVSYSAGSLCRKIMSRPTMVTVHEVWQGEWSRNMGLINGAIGSLLERRNLHGRFDRYIAVSDFTRERIIERLRINPEDICVIRNGVDRDLFDSVEVNNKFDSPTVVTICRLVPYKHVDILIEAVNRLRSRYPDVKLLIIGKGPEETHLRQLVQRMGLSRNVEFLGKLPDPRDMIRTMKKSHVFSLPSTVEGFGMVVVEAMAAGVPYVASDIPPLREVTKGGLGGKLIRPLDAQELAEGIGEAFQDPRLIDAPRVSTVLDEYDWKTLAMNYETEARGLVESSAHRASPKTDIFPGGTENGADHEAWR